VRTSRAPGPDAGPGRPGVSFGETASAVRTGHPDTRAERPKKLVVQCFVSLRPGCPASANRRHLLGRQWKDPGAGAVRPGQAHG